MTQRLILHIGQHKTGSKALQSALHANAEQLRSHGYVYPIATGGRRLRPYEMNHHPLFQLLCRAISEDSGMQRARSELTQVLKGYLKAGKQEAGVVILSCEDLFDMHTAHENKFSLQRVEAGCQLLAESLASLACQVSLIVYLRRQDHLLAAHYAQFIKGSDHHLSFPDYHRMAAARLDHDAILAHWESAFGSAAVRVFAYEPWLMPAGIVGDFFSRVLGIEAAHQMTPYPTDLEAFNITPPRQYIELIRLLNQRRARGQEVLPRERVLDVAFAHRHADRQEPLGIAAWWSPRQRAELLQHHQDGNARIADRHGLAPALFREPPPDPAQPWAPFPDPDLDQQIALDGALRRLPDAAEIVWVVPRGTAAADLALAARLCNGVIGHPRLSSRIHDHLPQQLERAAMVVLVGAVAARHTLSQPLDPLHARAIPCVLVLATLPIEAGEIAAVNGISRHLSALFCADAGQRQALQALAPALANRAATAGQRDQPSDSDRLAALAAIGLRRLRDSGR